MRAPPLFATENLSVTPPLVSVFSDLYLQEVAAFLHEEGREGIYYAKMRFSLDRNGMLAELYEERLLQREVFRPPEKERMREELIRRIRKFARHYGVPLERIRFETWNLQGQEIKNRFDPPPLWLDSRTLRSFQEAYDLKIHEEKRAHALKLFQEGERQLQQGRFRAALRHFRDASQITPDFYLPFVGLGEILLQENKGEEAQQYLERAQHLLEETQALPSKERQKGAKRIEEALRHLKAAREAQKEDNQTSASEPPRSSSPPSLGKAEWAAPIQVSFSFENLPVSLVDSYQRENFEPFEFYSLRLEAERLRLFEGFDELLAPLHARIESYEHQIRTARIVLRRMQGRALLSDEVGLGKTIEAGLILKEYLLRGMVSKVLVLTPPSLVSQWQIEMNEKFDLPFVTTEEIERFESPSAFWSSEPFVVASLAVAKREPHQSLILNQDYGLIIVDEAHHLRNRQTLAWKFVNQLKKKYLLLLTATPLHNDLEELYNLTTLLRPGQLGTPSQFKSEFAERGNSRKPKNTEKLRSLLREIMIRNTRASSGVRLPQRIARTISIELSGWESELYHLISAFVRDLARWQGKTNRFLLTLLQRETGSSVRAAFLTLQKLEPDLSGGFRLQGREIMERIQNQGEQAKLSALLRILAHHSGKCLVFTEFLGTHGYLVESLRRAGHDPVVFHGSLPSQKKAEAIQKFQDSGRILVSTPAGGEGTNLQFCRTIVNYDLPWNPMKIEQRIGRIHRIGQTGEVLIYNLAAKETVEYYLLKILDEKLNLFELVAGETETILGELTEEKDFEEILMDIWLEAANAEEAGLKMEDLGQRILEEKEKYLQTKRLDEALFGGDYETV